MPRIPKELTKLAVDITTVQEHPLNARIGDVDTIMESLRTNGQYRPIVVNKRNGYVLAGNHTHRAATNLKWKKIAVTYVDATDEEERRILAVDNASQHAATYDDTKLLALLEPLGDLVGTGWTKDALVDVWDRQRQASATKPTSDPNSIPDPPAYAPICKPGDLWKLGPHRLLVGSALDTHDLDAVMNGDSAKMLFTDPPYNVDYNATYRDVEEAKRLHRRTDNLTIQNDSMPEEAFIEFLTTAFTNVIRHLGKGCPYYICSPSGDFETSFRLAIRATPELLFKQQLVWAKHSLVLGRMDYQWQHETMLYGWREGRAHRWFGGRNKSTLLEDDPTLLSITPSDAGFRIRIGNGTKSIVLDVPSYDLKAAHEDASTIWRFNKPSSSPLHPTMKPVELVQRAITNSTKLREIVLDPFAGSGTTMIACEIEGRIARLVELDPRYADVICRRYQEYTGTIPIRDGEPVSFAPREDEDNEGEDD